MQKKEEGSLGIGQKCLATFENWTGVSLIHGETVGAALERYEERHVKDMDSSNSFTRVVAMGEFMVKQSGRHYLIGKDGGILKNLTDNPDLETISQEIQNISNETEGLVDLRYRAIFDDGSKFELRIIYGEDEGSPKEIMLD